MSGHFPQFVRIFSSIYLDILFNLSGHFYCNFLINFLIVYYAVNQCIVKPTKDSIRKHQGKP